MLVCRTFKEIREFLDSQKEKGRTIGFVPTMGALHQGHLSLLEESKKQCDVSVCSIFVNPTQFNNPKDLETYPRTEQNDLKLLESINCDAVLVPNVSEVYPPEYSFPPIELNGLDRVMEGAYRPGHFDGVVQVVWRFFDQILPDKAFFGEKDFQQVAVIQRLVEVKNSPIKIVPCEILREESGLAMSSRNVRLSPEGLQKASFIFKKLAEAKLAAKSKSPMEIKNHISSEFDKKEEFKLEYFELCDAKSLQRVNSFNTPTRAFVAVEIEGVRLIDNLAINY